MRQLPSGSWRAEYRDAAGQRHGLTFASEQAALVWAQDEERKVARGIWRDPAAGRITLQAFHDLWWAARVAETSTLADNRYRLDRHILPTWGERPLDTIRPLEVQAWVQRLGRDGSAPATVRKLLYLLSAMLDAAVLDGLIDDNPARHVELPPVAKTGTEVYFTDIEIDRLTALSAEQVDARRAKPMPGLAADWAQQRTMLRTLAYTGLRWGELAGLHVGRLDLLRAQASVVETYVHPNTLKHYPKGRRARAVPLDPDVVAMIAAHLERTPPAPCGLAHRGRHACSGLVFHYRARAWSRATFSHYVWHPARLAADLPYGRVHDLRHTFASWLVQDGVPLAVVSRLLGHESQATTERYAHLAPDATLDDRVTAALRWRAERASGVRQKAVGTERSGPLASVSRLPHA